jgi:hypothetical protein
MAIMDTLMRLVPLMLCLDWFAKKSIAFRRQIGPSQCCFLYLDLVRFDLSNLAPRCRRQGRLAMTAFGGKADMDRFAKCPLLTRSGHRPPSNTPV